MKRLARALSLSLAVTLGIAGTARAEVEVLRIPVGAGGVGFLPLNVIEKLGLVEKHAKAAGIDKLSVTWVNVGGPAAVNDAILSGAADIGPTGPPGFLTLWSKTRGTLNAMGVAAMTSMPMYLNTRSEHIRSLKDLKEGDKIAVTAVKVSIPAIIMHMYAAKELGRDKFDHFDKYTVSMSHPDGLAALLSGKSEINLHFTSPPFHQRERRDPAIRTIMTTSDVMGGSTTFTLLFSTQRFRDANPRAMGVFYKALAEAIDWINADKTAAAKLFCATGQCKGEGAEAEVLAILGDPEVKFTTTPENVMKYAAFMGEIGTLKAKPADWKELFFPEAHGLKGN